MDYYYNEMSHDSFCQPERPPPPGKKISSIEYGFTKQKSIASSNVGTLSDSVCRLDIYS